MPKCHHFGQTSFLCQITRRAGIRDPIENYEILRKKCGIVCVKDARRYFSGASGVYVRSSVCKRNRRWVIFNSIGFGVAGQKKTFRVTRQCCEECFSHEAALFRFGVWETQWKLCASEFGEWENPKLPFEGIFRPEKRHENDISMQERTVGWEEDRYFRVIFKIIAIFLAVAAASCWPYDSSDTLLAAVQLFKKSCKIVPLQYRASACSELKFSAEMCFWGG